MSKLYIVRHRTFTNEKTMKNYLLRLTESVRRNTKVSVYSLEKEIMGDFIDIEMVQNKRDLQLKGLLEGSCLLPLVESFRLKVEASRPKDRYYGEGEIILNKLSIINDEKSLSDLVGKHILFLFRLEKSVEWYKTILQARSLRGIPAGYAKRIWDTSNRKYIIVNPEEETKLFMQAKEELKIEKSKKKIKQK